MKAIILCRMGSSRLPGKTLYPFLGKTILHFIVNKLVLTGFTPSEIVVTTTTLAEDDVLETFAHETGVRLFRGSATNISNRLSKCCEQYQINRFMLVLGDNPWISLEQLKMLYELESDASSAKDYVVTPTPELGANGKTFLHYPIGTRIQTITRALLDHQIGAYDNPETQEHVSKLFTSIDPSKFSAKIFQIEDGWTPDALGGLNISINTKSDYEDAVYVADALESDGIKAHQATVADIVARYRAVRGL